MIQLLRARKPSIKVVALVFDSWLCKATLTETAHIFDVIWTSDSPSLPLWNEPGIAGKVLQCFVPLGLQMNTPTQPLQPQILFSGDVRYSWIRLFWLLIAVDRLGLPIKQKFCTHHDDGLSAMDSYAVYLQGLADATCCINFSMRPDLSTIYSGRCSESILAGSLLLQETSANVDYYFVAGEHYLEFASVSELAAIACFIAENPDAAEEIRRRGHAFAREHYNDEKLIGYLDNCLYFSAAP